MKSKNQIAREMYDGQNFHELYGGEKAAVTKAYNKQKVSSTSCGTCGPIKIVKIGRLGSGQPLKEFPFSNGTTVRDLLRKAKIEIDEDKEAVNAQSVGEAVDLDSKIVHGETYIVTPEIKSA